MELHFEGKPVGKKLYEIFKSDVKKQLASFQVESLKCCIHFVSTFTFAAVKILKNKIQVDFSLSRKIKSKRIKQYVQMSAHRFLYVIEILNEGEIDKELIDWVKEAFNKRIKELAV